MTPLAAAISFAAEIDRAAAIDAAREWPQHEELYQQIGDLAGGLGYDIKTRIEQTLTDILPVLCEAAAQKVADENPDEIWHGLGGNDPDAGMSGWLEDAMADAHDATAKAWVVEARKLAGAMLETADMRVAA